MVPLSSVFSILAQLANLGLIKETTDNRPITPRRIDTHNDNWSDDARAEGMTLAKGNSATLKENKKKEAAEEQQTAVG